MAQLAVFRPPIPFVFPRRFLHFVENLRKQVAPDGAEILEEHLVLETGRRAAALLGIEYPRQGVGVGRTRNPPTKGVPVCGRGCKESAASLRSGYKKPQS